MAETSRPGKATVAALAVLGMMQARTGLRTPQETLSKGLQRARAAAEEAGALRRRPHVHAWAVLRRAVTGFINDRLMAESAGVTFYVMLALFPAIASLISLYGLIADPRDLYKTVDMLSGVVPGGGIDIIEAQLKSLTSTPQKALGFGFAVSLFTSLWSANAGVKAFFDALNVVHREPETRSYLRLTGITFCFTIGLIVLLILALGAIVLVPIALHFIGFGTLPATLLRLARWPLLLFAVSVALSFLYRYGPAKTHARLRWTSWGSAFAACAWVLASLGFSYYVSNFGSYNKTYGSLGAAMGFMTWIWVSVMVVLVGAELDVEIRRQKAQAASAS